MASTANRRGNVKCSATGVIRDHLEELTRAGAREMLTRALNEEVEAYLGRGRYERSGEASDAARLLVTVDEYDFHPAVGSGERRHVPPGPRTNHDQFRLPRRGITHDLLILAAGTHRATPLSVMR